jgi:hypothetical protein
MDRNIGFLCIVNGYLNELNLNKMKDFLILNSNLPGPRSNLELLYMFSNYFKGKTNIDTKLLDFLFELSEVSVESCIVDSRLEYLPCCSIVALGEQYLYVNLQYRSKILEALKRSMNDSRWRVREGAAMCLQQIAEADFSALKNIIETFYENSNFLEKRAFVAGLAHPPILKVKDNAIFSLNLCEDILNEILKLSVQDIKTDSFKTLSKGLEYSISVFVQYAPEEGFDLMKKFALSGNKQIYTILISNLGKSRLKKNYIDQVNEVINIIK